MEISQPRNHLAAARAALAMASLVLVGCVSREDTKVATSPGKPDRTMPTTTDRTGAPTTRQVVLLVTGMMKSKGGVT